MKNKKKKLPLIIGLSSAGLLLGGLVCVGIVSFPDLLKADEEVAEVKEVSTVRHMVNGEEVILADEPGAAVGIGGAGYVSASNDSDVEFIIVPSNSEVSISNSSSKSHHIIEEQPVFFVEDRVDYFVFVDQTTFVVNEPVVNDNGNYISHSETIEETAPLQISKTKKSAISRNQSMRSNEAVVETSLIVVGAVDLLSVILIKRKKHLFR